MLTRVPEGFPENVNKEPRLVPLAGHYLLRRGPTASVPLSLALDQIMQRRPRTVMMYVVLGNSGTMETRGAGFVFSHFGSWPLYHSITGLTIQSPPLQLEGCTIRSDPPGELEIL